VAQKIQTLDIDDLDGTEAEGTVASGWTAPRRAMLETCGSAGKGSDVKEGVPSR
jgi:hypothetical protein